MLQDYLLWFQVCRDNCQSARVFRLRLSRAGPEYYRYDFSNKFHTVWPEQSNFSRQ